MSDVDALSSDGTVFGDGRVVASPLPAAGRDAAGRVVGDSVADEMSEIEPYDDGPNA